VKSLDCLTLTIVVIGGLSAAAPSAWATDTKKSAPAPAPVHVAPPPPQVRPQPTPQARPAQMAQPARPAQMAQPARPAPQMRPPAMAAGRPNPAAVPHPAAVNAPARPSPVTHPAATPQTHAPAATPQTHAAEPRGTAPSSVHPEHPRQAEPSRRSEPRDAMAAGHGPVAAVGQRPGMAAGQPRLNERVRDPAREHETARLHEHDFHTKDVRRFDVREREHWRSGRWHNDFHSGRFGWWYEVDDVWYAYPAPVFPYPLAVAPIVVEEAVGPVADDQPPPAAVAAAAAGFVPLPPLPKAAYHCGNPEGFFPVVEACSIEWVAVGAH
jgi:hypothetical protein